MNTNDLMLFIYLLIYSAGLACITRGPCLDGRIWPLKTVPALEELKKIIMVVDP